jgi:predicted transposase YbfD/YdcC
MDILQTALSALAILLSLIALCWTWRTQRVQLYDSMVNAFERMNTLALQDNDNLKAIYHLHFPDDTCDDIVHIRKHWLCYPVLNALELTFFARKHKVIRKTTADRILSRVPALARDKDIQRIIQEDTYTPEFTKYITGYMPNA